jgi:hypothetical protein
MGCVEGSGVPALYIGRRVPIGKGRTKVSVKVRGFVCEYFVTKIRFHSEELLDPPPSP